MTGADCARTTVTFTATAKTSAATTATSTATSANTIATCEPAIVQPQHASAAISAATIETFAATDATCVVTASTREEIAATFATTVVTSASTSSNAKWFYLRSGRARARPDFLHPGEAPQPSIVLH